jgi:hypothetical protein
MRGSLPHPLRRRPVSYLFGSLLATGALGCVGDVHPGDVVDQTSDPSTANPVDAGGLPNNTPPLVPGQPFFDAGPNPNSDSDADTGEPVTGPCAPGAESLVERLVIDDIALYQAVKIPLVAQGRWQSEREVPVVQGRKSLLRVFATPQAGYSAHPVLARLSLSAGGNTRTLEQTVSLDRASSDEDRASTFNFDLEGELVGPDTQLSVALLEPVCDPERQPNPAARFPAQGEQALEASALGPLEVVLVPVRLGTRQPDTGSTMVENIRSALLATYPVPSVNVRVAPVLSWNYEVNPDGSGWSELLNEVRRQRQRDQVGRNVYYFGLVAPASSIRSYCAGSCVLGLAPQTVYVSSADQVGLGIGFLDENTYSTAVHEIGHAHGRGHSPCAPRGSGIQGVDSRYPHSGGDTGVWGWDMRDGSLMAPTLKDVMGYCEPAWISDYTYGALADRAMLVNNLANQKSAPEVTLGAPWHSLILYGDGSARWAGLITNEAPQGERESLRVLDAAGRVVANLDAARVPLAHSENSFLYIPEPEADWAVLELGELRIPLANVLPALQ